MQITLLDVRAAFLKLWEAKPVGDGDKNYYSAAFPIVPESANHKLIADAVQAVAKEKWADKAAGILTKIVEDGKIGFKRKPLMDAQGNIYEGFEGMFSVNASRRDTKGRPLIIGRDKQPLTAADGKPYAGCYVNAILEVWAQDNKNGKRVNFELKGIQFVKDGDAFGAGAAVSEDAFPDLGDGAGANEEALI